MRDTRAMRAKCRRTEFHQSITWVTVRGVRVRRTVYDPFEWFCDQLDVTLHGWQRKMLRRALANQELRIFEPWHFTVEPRPSGYDQRMMMINLYCEQQIIARNKRPIRLTDITMS